MSRTFGMVIIFLLLATTGCLSKAEREARRRKLAEAQAQEAAERQRFCAALPSLPGMPVTELKKFGISQQCPVFVLGGKTSIKYPSFTLTYDEQTCRIVDVKPDVGLCR